MTPAWCLDSRRRELARAERDGVDLLVVGGGITGAAVLRDAATRGLGAFLVERDDFAAGTSSRSSKMVHGGLRYIAEGHLGLTREACRERDRLLRLNPHLVRPVPFLFPAWEDSKVPLWQVRAALLTYEALASFRRSARHRMLAPGAVAEFAPGLRRDALQGAGLYYDAQCDDARLVVETLASAHRLGAGLANHTEVRALLGDRAGRICGARVRDRISGRDHELRCRVVVNATGASVDRLRGQAGAREAELRPAKGAHLVLAGGRVKLGGVVAFEAADGRHLFLAPIGGALLLGTTDTWSHEIDAPVTTIEDVHYLLDAANRAFPHAGLTTNDIRAAFAGVRPLVASPDETRPPGSVSRDHRITEEASGLLSVFGGKLTTHRATGQAVVDRALRRLDKRQRRALAPSRTAELPLQETRCDVAELEEALRRRFELPPAVAEQLVRAHGADAERVLEQAPAAERRPIGRSPFTFAELRFALTDECAASLCDVLERRVRLALYAEGQGLLDLEAVAQVAAEAGGWDDQRTREEIAAYAHSVRRGYQIAAPLAARDRAAEAAEAA